MTIRIEETNENEICPRCAHEAGISKGGVWVQLDILDPKNPKAGHRHAVLELPDDTPPEQVERARRFFVERVNEWGGGHNHPVWVSRKNATDAALVFDARLLALDTYHRDKPWYADVKRRLVGMSSFAWAEAEAKGGPA